MTGVSGQALDSSDEQGISCKKGEVHNGTACICDTGFHLSLGQCINTIYFTCFITVGAVVVAFILVASVFMYREGIHVDTKESNQIEIMSKFQSSCRVRNEDPELPTKARLNEDGSSNG